MFSGNYNSIPTCFSAIPSTTTECALWGTCLDTNLEITLTLQNGPGGVPQLNFTVTDLVLSTGTGCTGGTATPGGSDVFEEIAQGQALAIIQDAVTNNVPPIRLDGLDFEGIITLQDLKLLMIENAGDPQFEDYIGITADPVP
jgi:hypothetical protein